MKLLELQRDKGQQVPERCEHKWQSGALSTGPLKPKYARKNRLIGNYVHKKGLDEGFNFIYVATIFLG